MWGDVQCCGAVKLHVAGKVWGCVMSVLASRGLARLGSVCEVPI